MQDGTEIVTTPLVQRPRKQWRSIPALNEHANFNRMQDTKPIWKTVNSIIFRLSQTRPHGKLRYRLQSRGTDEVMKNTISTHLNVKHKSSKNLEVSTKLAIEKWMFHPISNSRAHEEVIDQITFAVQAGAFEPGERLPQIDELSRSMNVSRPVVGEALKVLSQAGIVRVQRGINGGVTVLNTSIPESVMAIGMPNLLTDISEIVEARRPIELQIATLVGQRANEEDFETLESCIEAQSEHRRSTLEKRIRYDHLFHYNMGRAARSQLLALYQHQILEQIFLRLRSYFKNIEDVDTVIELHRETLRALRTRDRKKIEKAIDRHLTPLEQAVSGAGISL